LSFKSVFIAVFLGTALIVAALIVNAARPRVETKQPSAALVRATGKCAECHRQETGAVVHEFERSRHAEKGVTCLDCHRPAPGQASVQHKGFTLAAGLTSKNCEGCHVTEYEQFARSRHAGPAWSAVVGERDFSPEQIAAIEKYHPGAARRAANPLVHLEGQAALEKGCASCHAVGKPNPDGSFGSCTYCHSRHDASVALAREPTTCGQCHMGPDHSQVEIYEESKHGVLFAAQRDTFRMDADPKELTTLDMPVPTCATCHMSGLEGLKVTHDVGSRLSWFLFAAVSDKRPSYQQGQDEMKEVCDKCHARSSVDVFYREAEAVVAATNDKVRQANEIVTALGREGLLTDAPFDQEIDFIAFDLWHYYGRTAKHGAFMGGADFVQWHGNYELLRQRVKLTEAARALRARAKVREP
jgi:hydroxylamine dehydrogenase